MDIKSHDYPMQWWSPIEYIQDALAVIHGGKISLLDFLSKVLDPTENELKLYCTAMYSVPKDGPPKIHILFDLILSDTHDGPLFHNWIGAHWSGKFKRNDNPQ
jgi:hypothetical protein